MRDLTERSPRRETEGDVKNCCCTPNYSNLAARARRHDHGVLVVAERRDGIVTSQVFADLNAAERKVWRTRERGLQASLTLVRLLPVPHVALDELEGGGQR